MRLISAAEVNFIFAEAALKGWASGSAAGYYAEGIKQSFNAWGVGSQFNDYITKAPYSTGWKVLWNKNGLQAGQCAQESWFDWRRTGFPDLKTGASAKRVLYL